MPELDQNFKKLSQLILQYEQLIADWQVINKQLASLVNSLDAMATQIADIEKISPMGSSNTRDMQSLVLMRLYDATESLFKGIQLELSNFSVVLTSADTIDKEAKRIYDQRLRKNELEFFVKTPNAVLPCITEYLEAFETLHKIFSTEYVAKQAVFLEMQASWKNDDMRLKFGKFLIDESRIDKLAEMKVFRSVQLFNSHAEAMT